MVLQAPLFACGFRKRGTGGIGLLELLLGDAPLADMAAHLGLKEQMTRKQVASLEAMGVVVKRRKRNPVTFVLSDEFKEWC